MTLSLMVHGPQIIGSVDFLGLCSGQQVIFLPVLYRLFYIILVAIKNYKIWLETFYFMSNFLWNIIFALCNIMFILPQNSRNRKNTEHASP